MNIGKISITSVSKNVSISHQELKINIKQKRDQQKNGKLTKNEKHDRRRFCRTERKMKE
jgi:hypothetical protein